MTVHTMKITPEGSLTFVLEGYQFDETIFDFAPQLRSAFDVIVADVAAKGLDYRFCETGDGRSFTHDISGLEVFPEDSADPLLDQLISVSPAFIEHIKSLEAED